MNRQALDQLKQQIPLLDYLQAHDWQPVRQLSRDRLMGLCPLHADHKPSFLVDPRKSLFYCYGCGRGGDVIRFAELYHQVKFPQALSLLYQWRGLPSLLHEVVGFYRMQLHRHSDALAYLDQRGVCSPELIEYMRIGYAPGGCLRAWLTQLGYPLSALRQAGLVSAAGYDTYINRIVFPLEGNLYGRSISASAPPHRFLPGTKGGLYAWEQVRQYQEVVLVEGLFDYAVLWQAGFHNVTCSMGNHLNACQFRQLCDGARTVYLTFDADINSSGPQAAQSLACRLMDQGLNPRRVSLPEGHDPNSFFVQGGDARQFPMPVGGGARMTFRIIHSPGGDNARSPFRVIVQPMGREVEWVNRFLDRECVRRLAENTLRSYAMDLLHFLRWWASLNDTDAISQDTLSAPVLLDYLRFQAGYHPQPAAATINRRVGVVERALRNAFPDAASPFAPGFHHLYWQRSPLGCSHPRPALSRLRVKEPKRIVMPLSVDEVGRFWSSFRTSRDLAIVGLMLLQGLRSNEVTALNCEDVFLAESQIRVCGKGNKIRILPLASDTVLLLDHYLRLERPQPCGPALFVSLKGPARGARMTSAGMRSLFRHHRRATGIAPAHPHRFRHTFASDMVRAGISLPALMQLMGHAHISTTMVYVQISPRDVFEQYARAVAQQIRPTLPVPL